MPNRIVPFKSFTTTTQTMPVALRKSLYNLGAQLQLPSSLGIVSSSVAPRGQKEGDTTMRVTDTGAIEVSVYDGKGQPATSIIAADANSNVSFQTGTVPPALVNFPTDGSNGEYYDTNLGQLWVVRNYQGTLIYPNFVSISGTITATQHGNLNASAGVMHAFTQLSGTITDTQHGSRAGGTLHSPASGSAAGFMTIGQFNLIANATDAATPSTLVERDASGNASFVLCTATTFNATSQYRVANTRVVSTRKTGWTAITGTVSRATFATYTAPTITGPSVAEVQAIANALQNVSRMVGALQADLGTTSGHGLLDN